MGKDIIRFESLNESKKTILASELYKFLELSPSHFSRWCKKHIVDNPYVEKGVDVTPLRARRTVGNVEKDITDYELTISTAKKLCMVSKSDKAEQIRNYFIDIEKRFLKAKETYEESESIMKDPLVELSISYVKMKAEQEKQKQEMIELQSQQIALLQKYIGLEQRQNVVEFQTDILERQSTKAKNKPKNELKKKIRQMAFFKAQIEKIDQKVAENKIRRVILDTVTCNSIDGMSEEDFKNAWDVACSMFKQYEDKYYIFRRKEH